MTLDILAEFARRKEHRVAELAARVCRKCGKPLNRAAHYRGSDGPVCRDHSWLYGERR